MSKRESGQKMQRVFYYVAVTVQFKCIPYPERQPEDEPEIVYHFLTVSRQGSSISEQDITHSHEKNFSHHQVLEYNAGRPWQYGRNEEGRTVMRLKGGRWKRV